MNHGLRAVGVLLSAALAGCVTPESTRYPYFLEPGHEGAPGAETWLVAPSNFSAPIPEHISAQVDEIADVLVEFIDGSGRSATALSMGEITRVASQVPSDLGEVESLAELARQLAAQAGADVVLFPNVTTQEARARGDLATWHGVQRQARIVRHQKGAGNLSLTGDALGLSLSVRVFDSNGGRVFESYGGLELAQEYHVFRQGGRWRWRARVRQDLLTERQVLREGAELALFPYVVIVASPE